MAVKYEVEVVVVVRLIQSVVDVGWHLISQRGLTLGEVLKPGAS